MFNCIDYDLEERMKKYIEAAGAVDLALLIDGFTGVGVPVHYVSEAFVNLLSSKQIRLDEYQMVTLR